MAKRKKYSASKCPEPLNTMIDLAGAIALGAFTKHQIKKDYQRGRGPEAVKAATMVYGTGAMRRGSKGVIALGGLYGVNSAIRDIEKGQATAKRRTPAYDDKINFSPYKNNDNRYAWRLNCEDGSAYGVSPENYETRDAYNRALSKAKEILSQKDEVLRQSLEWISYSELDITKTAYDDLAQKVRKYGIIDNPPTFEEFVK